MTEAQNLVIKFKAERAAMRVDEKYDNTTLHKAAHRMQAEGGHFAGSIAQAYFCADLHNRRKLLDAFGDLFERFIGKEDTEAPM
jgi:3'-phosphoadenosine 5'-phosphosulfate sulfotransferase